ncbi:AraC family transcriptional regulator [Clostridium swellfunianum]|uniref:AraC family transcriptional regulator n=1 Tax=Clostridium swellfunianum TaxID=1367462 RepID=UPI00202FA20E|nr:AraC family transcriptional regulator [Clostridium swellfunianum]MCM0646864.1 AraC family transcriptional regulator [Clostridium swellfunianum]
MNFTRTVLNDEFQIDSIITVHYFEFACDYIFEGETHNFWELVYVDKGELEIMADDKGFKLKQGEMIFHKPNEFHNLWANGKIAPNIIVISFECRSKAMKFFENKIVSTGDVVKNLLAQIIKEALEAFSTPLNVSSTTSLEKKTESLFGSEQLIKIYLQQLLIYLVRRSTNILPHDRLSSSVRERTHNDMTNKIISYLEDNLRHNITFNDVCQYSSLSPTTLKAMFKELTGTGVMEYYKSLKVEEAKKLIREGKFNFTEIAEILGYSSIHYLSRQFKNATGMSPSEYASSVKAKI